MSLTPENTLNECFEFFERGENAVQVIPFTVKQQSDDTRLAILVRGTHEASSVIFAELMMKVEELFDMQAQVEATREPESSIITS